MRGKRSIGSAALGVLMYGAVAMAQTAGDVGPTLESRAMTAGKLARTQPRYTPSILDRHATYEREMALAFGIPIREDALNSGMEIGFMHDMGRWMATYWGGSVFNHWAQSAAQTYLRIEESATIRARGFDMGVDVDDVARGRFGIRLDRALE